MKCDYELMILCLVFLKADLFFFDRIELTDSSINTSIDLDLNISFGKIAPKSPRRRVLYAKLFAFFSRLAPVINRHALNGMRPILNSILHNAYAHDFQLRYSVNARTVFSRGWRRASWRALRHSKVVTHHSVCPAIIRCSSPSKLTVSCLKQTPSLAGTSKLLQC